MSTSITSNKLDPQQLNINTTSPINTPTQQDVGISQELLSQLSLFFSSSTTGISNAKPKLEVPIDADISTILANTSKVQTGALSLESLMSALNFNERKQAVREGLESIEARGKEKAELNQEKLKALQENLEKENSPAKKFLKAFQIIGVIVATVASLAITAASIASSAITFGATAALVVGSAFMLASSINSMVSICTDGEKSLGNAIGKIAEKCGMEPEAAKWVGVGFEVAISLVGIVCSLGGSIATTAKEVVSTGTKLLSTITKISTLAAGASSVATGATQIASAVIDKEIADNQAFMKELEAILLAIQNADDRDLDFVKEQIELSNSLLETINSIIAANNQANTAIMTAAPAMA